MKTAPELLRDAAETLTERACMYGRDGEPERSMSRIVEAFNTATGHVLSEGDGWLFMVVLKVVRAARGAAPGLDTFRDMAGYAALAGECYGKTTEEGE